MSDEQKRQLKINYVAQSRVIRIFERIEKVHVNGIGRDAVFADASYGWYIALEGSYEAIHIGDTRPEWQEGDLIKVTFERITG